MSDISENIKTTFGNLLKIYNESGSLMQDAESMMENAGYSCIHGNTTGTTQSKNFHNPQWWITPFISRYYSSDVNPSVING